MGKLAYDALKESFFQQKMEVCRWEGFAVILSDLLLITAFWFKDQLGKQAPSALEFAKIYGEVLAKHPLPEHRKNWDEPKKTFQRRIDVALKNRPLSVKSVAEVGGRALLKLVPLGDLFKDHDSDIFLNTVRLGEMNFERNLHESCNPKDLWEGEIKNRS